MARRAPFESRLEEDKDKLEKYFYPEKFPILGESEEPYFEREVKFKNGYVYKLRVCITKGYPDVLPDLVVSQSPEAQPMPSSPLWSGSHITHTWPRRQDGLLKICYFHPDCWTRDNKIYQVFKKGEKWLKVYVLKHLVRRKPMNFYLKDMIPTEEEKMKAERRKVQIGLHIIACGLKSTIAEITNLDENIIEDLCQNLITTIFMASMQEAEGRRVQIGLHIFACGLKSTIAEITNLDENIIERWCLHFIENFAAQLDRMKEAESSPRAILNNPTPSPHELFLDPFGHEFMSAFAAKTLFEEWRRQFIVNFMYPPPPQIDSIAHNTE